MVALDVAGPSGVGLEVAQPAEKMEEEAMAKASQPSAKQRRVSLSRSLANLHALNAQQQGTERLGTILVCCITALFLGQMLLGMVLRRQGGVGRRRSKA